MCICKEKKKHLPFPDAPAAALGGVLGGSVDLDSACLGLGSFSKYFSNPLGGLLHSFLCLRHPDPLRKGNRRTVAFISCGKCCKYKSYQFISRTCDGEKLRI